MLLKASPRRPSPTPEANSVERFLASSMVWSLMVRPPMVTLSVPTVPEAEEPSP